MHTYIHFQHIFASLLGIPVHLPVMQMSSQLLVLQQLKFLKQKIGKYEVIRFSVMFDICRAVEFIIGVIG